VPRKTRITKITIETHRRVLIRKPGGQTGGDKGTTGEIVVDRPPQNSDPGGLRTLKEIKPNEE
jgi:hypothetical protein